MSFPESKMNSMNPNVNITPKNSDQMSNPAASSVISKNR